MRRHRRCPHHSGVRQVEHTPAAAEIGRVLGVSRTSIYRALHRDLAGPASGGGGQRRRWTAALAAQVAPVSAGAGS